MSEKKTPIKEFTNKLSLMSLVLDEMIEEMEEIVEGEE